MSEKIQIPRLAIIIGHTKNSPGASMNHSEFSSEYDYNSQLWPIIERAALELGISVKVFYRDGVGIAGAYSSVMDFEPDAAIELHFNAYNGRVRGTETLYYDDRDLDGVDERSFAQLVQNEVCEVFLRQGRENRGLKKVGPRSRGGTNLSQLFDCPSILVEPFFGDNKEDADLAARLMSEYAKSLVDAFNEWYNS